MAETLISPGVLARENDSSFISQGPVTAGAAIIGPTVKGPVEIPTVVTSYSQFQNTFGDVFTSGGLNYSFFTSIAAYNYFVNGGTSLLVARVVTGSYTSATSTDITNNIAVTPGAFATASKDLSALSDPINIEFRIVANSDTYRFLPTASGNYQDDTDGKLYFFASGALAATITNLAAKITSVSTLGITAANVAQTLTLSGSVSSSAYNGYIFQTGSGASFSNQATLLGGINGSGGTAFILQTLSEGIIMNSSSSLDASGSLISGSTDNVRWQIANSNSSSGTFDLLIRQGNDNTLEPIILETWTNLSLDPFSPNYIAKTIGDQKYTLATDGSTGTKYLQLSGSYPNRSNYVRVSSVTSNTPNYFDNNGVAKIQYTSSIPINASGSFTNATGDVKGGAKLYNTIDATDTQGLTGGCYSNMIALLANQDDYKYNVLLTPGLYDAGYPSQVTNIITNTQNRGDAIYVLDPVAYGAGSISTVTSQAAARNTSYAAEYWPWVQIQDPGTGANVWVPASTVIGGVYAYNDSVSEPWFAPAGINRGGLSQVIRAERRLPQGDRDTLYSSKVNPIATFPGTGVVVYGQKTLQTKASALDRVNVRRLLIALKSYISQIANNLVFEQNTLTTRTNFLAQVNPYLESVQQRQGLYAFRVIMDDSNNTPDVIDRNQMVGQIYLQPTKTAEFIYLDFNITPTGATFPA